MLDIHVILQNRPGTLSRLTTLLGRPLRSYRDFAVEIAAAL